MKQLNKNLRFFILILSSVDLHGYPCYIQIQQLKSV